MNRDPMEEAPDFRSAVAGLDRATWESLRRALETGRWPDGRPLEARQRELCLEAVILWEKTHLGAEQATGRIEAGNRARETVAEERVRILDE